MAINPQDRPKLIGLSVALAGVFGYVLFALVPRLMAGGGGVSHSDQPPPPLTSVSATTAASPAATSDASAALPDQDMAPVPASPVRDSFEPPPAASHPAAPAQQPAQVKPAAPTIVQPLGPGAPAPGPIAAPAAPIAPPQPSVELKGVILGEPAVAVISINGEVVLRQVGETIQGAMKLTKISDVGITVQDGKRNVSITVGHMMASATAPMAAGTVGVGVVQPSR